MEKDKKFLIFCVLFAIAVSSCCGRFRGRFRSGYYRSGYYYSSYGSGTSTGTIIGAVIGGIIGIVGLIVVICVIRAVCCKTKQRPRNTGQMTTWSSNVPQTYAPPPYSANNTSYKTGIDYNIKDSTNYPQNMQYTTNSTPEQPPPPYPTSPPYQTSPPYPDAINNYPMQPYPSNDTAFAQDLPAQPLSNLYESKMSYDNQGMKQ